MFPPFIRPQFTLTESGSDDSIRSLLDLVRHNAKRNPYHVFALQEVREAETSSLTKITFLELETAITACATWLVNQHPALGHGNVARPVALYLESDVILFIHLCALLQLNVPVRKPIVCNPTNPVGTPHFSSPEFPCRGPLDLGDFCTSRYLL
jgi:hypothetical protein